MSEPPILDYTYKTEPLDHQRLDFTKTRDLSYWAWYWEMGTGKSKMVIDTACWLYQRKQIGLCLITAPKGAYLNWISEASKHCPVDAEVAYYSSSMNKETEAWLDRVSAAGPRLKFILVNIEAMSGKRGEDFCRGLLRHHRTLVVVDESTSIKGPTATRTRAMLRLRDMANCVARRILSGTPSPQSPLDLWSQLEFLQKGQSAFPTFTGFRSYFAIQQIMRMGMRSFPKITGFRNMEVLTYTLSKCSSRVLKKDCLDLPPKIYETRDVEMTAEQAAAYRSVMHEAMVMLEAKLLTVTSAMTMLVKLHQITCGWLKMDDGSIVALPNHRMRELDEGIDELPHDAGVIIWCAYREDARAVTFHLRDKHGPTSVVQYVGGIKDTERMEAIDQFQNKKTARFFVSTQASGGVGNTLTRCTYMVYYSNNYNLMDRMQSEDRAHRIGQSASLTIVDLLVRGTADEKVILALKKKQALQATLLDPAAAATEFESALPELLREHLLEQ